MYILNDYSIDNQFKDIDSLLDSLMDHTIPLLGIMDKYKLSLLKNHQIYELKIVKDLSIFEFLKLRGYPEIFKITSLLHKVIYDDPYWGKDDLNHDCIKEAIKRKTGLISFEHSKYLDDHIDCKVEDKVCILSNSYNRGQLIEELWERKRIDVHEYLQQSYPVIQSFCIIDDKNYFEDIVKADDIKQAEVDKIVNDLNDFMHRYLNKQDLGRLSRNLERNLHEFRTSLADSKEFRILYCINESKIVFLNCFIKKQQKIPESEKALGRKLRDSIINK